MARDVEIGVQQLFEIDLDAESEAVANRYIGDAWGDPLAGLPRPLSHG